MKLAPMSRELEQYSLGAVLKGIQPLKSVEAKNLSKQGKLVYAGIKALFKQKEPPLILRDVETICVKVLGGTKSEVHDYLAGVKAILKEASDATILQILHTKQAVIDIVNIAADQLNTGQFDLTKIVDRAQATEGGGERFVPLSQAVTDMLPELPSGFEIKGLPTLTHVTGGVFGLWIIGGEPAVGKSTLTIQIACLAQKQMPVIYYDFEQGENAVLSHLGKVFKGNLSKVRNATKQFYLRSSLKTINQDLQQIQPPALVVIDSLQSAPTSSEFRRAGMENWLRKFERMKLDGYTVIVVSEINRAFYSEAQKTKHNQAKKGAYKETGEIEYKADVGIELFRDPVDELSTEVHIVKNRHRPQEGLICKLERVNDWWFVEC